jgi:hypothetical protein
MGLHLACRKEPLVSQTPQFRHHRVTNVRFHLQAVALSRYFHSVIAGNDGTR